MKAVLYLISLVFVWAIVAAIIWMIDPVSVKDVGLANGYLVLTVPLFGAIWYTAALITRSVWSSLVISGLCILGLYLSMAGIMNYFLGGVIAVSIVFVVYILKRH